MKTETRTVVHSAKTNADGTITTRHQTLEKPKADNESTLDASTWKMIHCKYPRSSSFIRKNVQMNITCTVTLDGKLFN